MSHLDLRPNLIGIDVASLGVTRAAAFTNSYVTLPGTSGNYVSTPDTASLDITGDIEIVVRVALTDWTPASYGVFVCKNFTSYEFRIRDNSFGHLESEFNSGGKAFRADAATGISDGATAWAKMTVDVDNGAAGATCRFYVAADSVAEPTSWSQVGTDRVSAGTFTITPNASQLGIGARHDGSLAMTGRIYRAIVRNGIGGTTVADFNPNLWVSGSTFTSTDGRVYTLNGTAAITKA